MLRFVTPLTFADLRLGCLSQSQKMPGAWAETCLSMSPHAWARCAGSLTTSALLMASLTCGLSRLAKFELPALRMFLPLNVRFSSVSGSAKSFSQPTLGQIGGWLDGTWQYFVYIVWRLTNCTLTLNPSLANCAWATSATRFWLVALSETAWNVWPPVYLPLEKPAFFM